VVLSVFSGLDTVDKAHAYDQSQTRAAYDDGNAAQSRTNVLIGLTAAVVVLTAVAAGFFVDWRGKEHAP
jgi:hypothetical protein